MTLSRYFVIGEKTSGAARGYALWHRAHLVATTQTVAAGFQPASVGRILAASSIAMGGTDAARQARSGQRVQDCVPAKQGLQSVVRGGTPPRGASLSPDHSCSSYGAFFNPSHFTTQEPSSGKPGDGLSGAPSQPAAIIATA